MMYDKLPPAEANAYDLERGRLIRMIAYYLNALEALEKVCVEQWEIPIEKLEYNLEMDLKHQRFLWAQNVNKAKAEQQGKRIKALLTEQRKNQRRSFYRREWQGRVNRAQTRVEDTRQALEKAGLL